MSVKRFQEIAEEWFLTEPLLFSVYCGHRVVAAADPGKMAGVVLRSGQGRIEYNPEEICRIDHSALRELLKMEVIRILLKHPYQRQPQPVRKEACYWASDLVLQDYYQPKVRLFRKDDFPQIAFPTYKAAFEEYYKILAPLTQGGLQSDGNASNESGNDPSGTGGHKGSGRIPDNSSPIYPTPKQMREKAEQMREKAEQSAGLWQEDTLAQEEINRMIEVAEQSQNWGSIKGHLQELVIASTQVKIDCAKILNGFRGSIISSKRVLTRMRPNRRYGFDNMGSRHQFSTKLLVAIDVSGSVPTESIKQFFGIVNRIFKYGIDRIDAVSFDTTLKGAPAPIKKVRKEIRITGRGGTAYQPLFDFICEDGSYDGVVICTDGFAPAPYFKKRIPTQILWLFNEKAFYERHTWARDLPGSRAAFLS